jgi:hypothetical protein
VRALPQGVPDPREAEEPGAIWIAYVRIKWLQTILAVLAVIAFFVWRDRAWPVLAVIAVADVGLVAVAVWRWRRRWLGELVVPPPCATAAPGTGRPCMCGYYCDNFWIRTGIVVRIQP